MNWKKSKLYNKLLKNDCASTIFFFLKIYSSYNYNWNYFLYIFLSKNIYWKFL